MLPATNMSQTEKLVELLVDRFRAQLHNALKVELDDTPTSLAFVDHYLSRARHENREPILSLLAAGAGAYFGELIRKEIGGSWIGDGKDPRRLRLLIEPHFIHFSPVDLAFEAIAGESVEDDDSRHPEGLMMDTAFHLRPPTPQPDASSEASDDISSDASDRTRNLQEDLAEAAPRVVWDFGLPTAETDAPINLEDDAAWVDERLAALDPVAEDEFYSLTGRFETLLLILELLSVKHSSEGREPRTLKIADYAAILSGDT
jgi:hypothetical protein